MIPFIIGAGIGYLVNEIIHSEKDKSKDTNGGFFVNVRSVEFGKSSLSFSDYEGAKKQYDKIVKSKKIKYEDIVDFDASERKLFNEWKQDGKIGEDGYPSGLNQESNVTEVSFGSGTQVFEEKEIN